MKAAVYLRVSTERQDEGNQEPECLRLCEARGWAPHVVRERESGARDRPGWAEVLDLARRGVVRAVVIWSLDRVGRRMFQVVGDVKELHRYGCTVVSVREGWLDTGGPASALLLAIFGWVAEHERERLRERTRAGLARAKAQGKRPGPKGLPAPVIHAAATLRLNGHPWGRIARDLVFLFPELAGRRPSRGRVERAVKRYLSQMGSKTGGENAAKNG